MKSSRAVLSIVTLLLTGGGAACGGGGEGANGDVDAAVAGFDCANYAGAVCALLQRCAPLLDTIYFDGDAAACRALMRARCAPFQPRIDPTRGSGCIAALQNLACDEVMVTFPGFEIAPPPACATLGTGKVGDSCSDGIVCQSGRCPRRFASPDCGTCQPTLAEGKTCADLSDCDPGLLCVDGNQGKTCLRPVAQTCGNGMVCAGRASCVQGTCTRPALQGEKCDADGRTAARCDALQGLWCNAGTCVETPFAAKGQPCTAFGCRGSYCTKAVSCAAFPSDGASCADARDSIPACQYGAVCNGLDKTCQLVHSPSCQ